MNREFVIERFESDFDNFIDQLHLPNFIENGLEQFALDLRSHSLRAVDADQAGMKRNIGKLSTGPWIVRGTTKIDAVSGHKGPVSLQDEGFQFPVFPSSFAHPNHM
jgi:hypothetical protein